MERFYSAIARQFPCAMTEFDFVANSFQQLNQLGFDQDNTIACLRTCRDEITRSLASEIEEIWGESFNLAALSGLVSPGSTSIKAMLSHAPIIDGHARVVFYATAHIGISADGVAGYIQRPGMPHLTSACGALVALQNELRAGTVNVTVDYGDLEQSMLRQMLIPLLHDPRPSLTELTYLSHNAMVDDLQSSLDDLLDTNKFNYAVLTGIQIHGPEDEAYVWPGVGYAVVQGKRHALDLETADDF